MAELSIAVVQQTPDCLHKSRRIAQQHPNRDQSDEKAPYPDCPTGEVPLGNRRGQDLPLHVGGWIVFHAPIATREMQFDAAPTEEPSAQDNDRNIAQQTWQTRYYMTKKIPSIEHANHLTYMPQLKERMLDHGDRIWRPATEAPWTKQGWLAWNAFLNSFFLLQEQ